MKSGSSTTYQGPGISLTSGTGWGEYEFDLTNNSEWAGTITQLRIDPSGSCGTTSAPVLIAFDWIKTLQKPNNPPIVTFTLDQGEISHGWNNGVTVASHDPDGDSYTCSYQVNPGTWTSADSNGHTIIPASNFILGTNAVRVRCTDSHDAYGQPADQTVIDYAVPSTAPTGTSPSGSINAAASYDFIFSGATNADHYRVYIADNASFTNPITKWAAGSPLNIGNSELPAGKTYYWKVCGENKLDTQGTYSATLSFYVKPELTSISVTSPKEGDVLYKNQNYEIKWTSVGITGNVKIHLYKGGAFNYPISNDEANDGAYSPFAPTNALEEGTDYQICMVDLNNTASTCSGSFTITTQKIPKIRVEPSSLHF